MVKFQRLAICSDCNTILHIHETEEEFDEIRKRWTMIVMSLPLANFKCPKGCRSTWSDCNANVDVKFRRKGKTEILDIDDAKKLNSSSAKAESPNKDLTENQK